MLWRTLYIPRTEGLGWGGGYCQGCKFSDFCLISENFTLKYLNFFFEISSL